MEGYYIWQIILIGILVAVTIFYGYQTMRQANLLKKQIDENRESRDTENRRRSLEEINNWAIYGWNEVCFPGLGDWSKEGINKYKLTYAISRGGSVLYKAGHIRGDLDKQVKVVMADLCKLVEELKVDVEYQKLKGVEKKKYIKHIQGILSQISDRFAEIINSSSELLSDL